MNTLLLLATIGSAPLVSAHDAGRSGRRVADASDASWAASSSSKGDAGPFAKSAKGKKSAKSKSAKAKSGKSKAAKGEEEDGAHPTKLFGKAGKEGKSAAPVVPEYKVFSKSAKQGGKSAKAKSGKAGPFDKSGKKGGSYDAGVPDSWGAAGAGDADAAVEDDEKLPVPLLDDDVLAVDSSVGDNGSDTAEIDDGAIDKGTDSAPPTPRPTCDSSTEVDDFNLCIAIDGSGSVCSKGVTMPCDGCNPGLLCQDFGFGKDTCCRNFATIQEFSTSMIQSLAEFDAEKSFSIVQFSTDAQVEGGMSSAEESLAALDGMVYRGGYTNHASAIRACEETFDASASDRKKFILLITDGVSTWPRGDPEGSAEAAASAAKENGAIITPVFISAQYDEDALAFMRRLSSDGRVFDVTDFESLSGLQESLVDQVSCS